MRLIDKDALIKLGKKKYLGEDRECFVVKLDVFNNVPTVEAIPIEWLEREFSRRGIVTSHFRVMVGNEQLPDEVYVDARIVVRDIIDVWREEQKDETDRSRAFD